MNKKAKKILNKLLEKEKCPYCHKSLLENGIGWAEEGMQYYEVSLGDTGKNAYLDYDSREFNSNGDGYHFFFCRGCGQELQGYDEEQVIEILKLEENEKN